MEWERSPLCAAIDTGDAEPPTASERTPGARDCAAAPPASESDCKGDDARAESPPATRRSAPLCNARTNATTLGNRSLGLPESSLCRALSAHSGISTPAFPTEGTASDWANTPFSPAAQPGRNWFTRGGWCTCRGSRKRMWAVARTKTPGPRPDCPSSDDGRGPGDPEGTEEPAEGGQRPASPPEASKPCQVR
jgi:hypothetical protein